MFYDFKKIYIDRFLIIPSGFRRKNVIEAELGSVTVMVTKYRYNTVTAGGIPFALHTSLK